jgi:anti-sigma factor RsiW
MTRVCRPELVSRYLDGDLTLPLRYELETHLRGCEKCSHELAQLRHIDAIIAAWGASQGPVSATAERRINQSVEKRRGRLSPIVALSRMMPAAVGSSIAALLVLVSVNVGILQNQASAGVPSATSTSTLVLKQSRKLSDARHTAAVLGVMVTQQQTIPKHRTHFDMN